MYRQGKTIDNLQIIKGVIVGLLLMVVFIFVIALLSAVFFESIQNQIGNLLTVFSFFILIYVGFFIARRVTQNGWLNGGLGALVFMGIMLLLGSINIQISTKAIFLLLILGLIGGIIGGVIGVNFAKTDDYYDY